MQMMRRMDGLLDECMHALMDGWMDECKLLCQRANKALQVVYPVAQQQAMLLNRRGNLKQPGAKDDP
jgi:hypothetical protein